MDLESSDSDLSNDISLSSRYSSSELSSSSSYSLESTNDIEKLRRDVLRKRRNIAHLENRLKRKNVQYENLQGNYFKLEKEKTGLMDNIALLEDEIENPQETGSMSKSLLYFQPNHPIRRLCSWLLSKKWFDWIVLGLILLNVITLAIEDPLAPEGDNTNKIMGILDLMIGFVMNKGAYLRDGWNVFDFIINIISILGLLPSVARLNGFRTLRVLRALRALGKLKGLKLMVQALLVSFAHLANVAFLMGFLFVMFAIFSVQLWLGILHQQCYIPNTSNTILPILPPGNSTVRSTLAFLDPNSDSRCSLEDGGYKCEANAQCVQWSENPRFTYQSFDDIFHASLTLFVAMSTSGWVFPMYMVQDAYSEWVAIFFVIFILLCTMFAVNLALAVIATKFKEVAIIQTKKDNSERAKESRKRIIEEDSSSDGDQRLLDEEQKRVHTGWRKYFNKVASDIRFENFITVAIVANLIVLCIQHHNMSDAISAFIDIANYVFTALFFIELVVKLIGLGVRNFFKDNMNKFDFVVVLSSLLEIVVALTSSTDIGLIVFRAFRLLRVFKLARKWEGLNYILTTVMRALTSVAYLTLLLSLFIVTFALMGRQLLAGKFVIEGELRRWNYDTFWWSCVTTFQILTGDAWDDVMYDAMTINPWFAAMYCLTFILGTYVLLSLFVGVLLQKFAHKPAKVVLDENGNIVLLHSANYETEMEDDSSSDEDSNPFVVGKNDDERVLSTNQLQRHESTGLKVVSFGDSNRLQLKGTETKIHKQKPSKLTGKSLYLFAPDNKFRLKMNDLVSHSYFEWFIVTVISVNCILLAVETPDMSDTLTHVLFGFDIFFTVIYSLEAIAKIVAWGFILGPTTYMRDNWNIIDFVVLVLSLIGSFLPTISSLQALRSLRVLRLLSKFQGTKIAVYALGRAVPAVLNVFMVVLLFWVIFAVVGVNFFGGQFYRCNDDTVANATQCNGTFFDDEGMLRNRTWRNPPYHFDNVGTGLVTLFAMSTLSGWVDVMYCAVDANGIDQQPVLNNHPENAIFFVVFVIVGSFFALNLFTGAIIENFVTMKSRVTGSAFLTKKQAKWVYAQRILERARPKNIIIPPSNPVSRVVYKIVTNNMFEGIIMFCILSNSVILAIPYYGMSDGLEKILDGFNSGFLAIFTLESVLKIIGLGPKGYFGPKGKYLSFSWNKLDFLLVLGSILGLVLNTGPAVNVARLFRVARVMRLIKRLKGLHLMFQTFVRSLPSIANIIQVVLIIYFMFAVMGIKLFGTITPYSELGITRWADFSNFLKAMLTLFRISTLDTWPELMYSSTNDFECTEIPGADCGQEWFIAYYLLFIFIQSFIVLNLFLAVLIENFTDYHKIDIQMRRLKQFSEFRETWEALDPDGTSKIDVKHFVPLMLRLGEPLGIDITPRRQLIKELRQTRIVLTKRKELSFNQVLQGITLRATKMDLTKQNGLGLLLPDFNDEENLADYFEGLEDKHAAARKSGDTDEVKRIEALLPTYFSFPESKGDRVNVKLPPLKKRSSRGLLNRAHSFLFKSHESSPRPQEGMSAEMGKRAMRNRAFLPGAISQAAQKQHQPDVSSEEIELERRRAASIHPRKTATPTDDTLRHRTFSAPTVVHPRAIKNNDAHNKKTKLKQSRSSAAVPTGSSSSTTNAIAISPSSPVSSLKQSNRPHSRDFTKVSRKRAKQRMKEGNVSDSSDSSNSLRNGDIEKVVVDSASEGRKREDVVINIESDSD